MIDFYTGKTDPSGDRPVSYYLDVRPALDSWQAIADRASMAMRDYLPTQGAAANRDSTP